MEILDQPQAQPSPKKKLPRITYGYIARLSMPIMIGSAVQNLITLTDSIFLGRLGETEFAAIGLVGVFYMLITSIGYSFSKAGQILIARRVGEQDYQAVGANVYSMWFFAMSVALLLFAGMFFGGKWAFGLFVNSPDILQACADYLYYRAPGVFFSYTGVVVMALYTGVSRTSIILYTSLILGLSNFLLNYALVFGYWGAPAMGIGGAALASTLSEALSLVLFLGYLLFVDRKNSKLYGLLQKPKLHIELIQRQVRIATPIVVQSAIGTGSWFIFFLLIEDMGQHALAVSNLLRVVYLLFMIPSWGFASGLNTLVSQLIGEGRERSVMPIVRKTIKLCLAVTAFFSFSLVLFPDWVLRIGTNAQDIVQDAKALIPMLLVLLTIFCIGTLYFNGLVGTGATQTALYIQIFCIILYFIYIYIIVRWAGGGLLLAWNAEIIYWALVWLISWWQLRKGYWAGAHV